MRKQIIETTCDATGCDATTIERHGWGRWHREGQKEALDVCPVHDRQLAQVFVTEIPAVRRRTSRRAVTPIRAKRSA